MGTHTVVACPGCGQRAATTVDLDASHQLRRCTDCSLVYASEYADPDEIYVDGYLKGASEFGINVFDPLFQEFLDFAGDKRMAHIESLSGVGSLLDVGCGAGEVLAVAKRRGWEVAGAEPVEDSAAAARQRGLDVRTALLEDAGFPEGSWDVVTAFHVLEHVPDGAAFLRMLARWARPGGLVVIEVPNWASFDRQRHGARWPMLRPLEHIAHYEPRTLRQTFEAAGLEPVEVRTMGFLWAEQTLDQQLTDLARRRWRRALRPFSRAGERKGRRVMFPGPIARGALLATQAAYDRVGKGQVVIGAARVPR